MTITRTLKAMLAIAVPALMQAPAKSQDLAFGNWLAVKGQPQLQYRSTVQPGGSASPANCTLQIRATNPDPAAQYVGTLVFRDVDGHTLVRSLEVDLHPGRAVTTSAGPRCAAVTDVELKARTAVS